MNLGNLKLRSIIRRILNIKEEIDRDDLFTGAAALSFYLILSIFPAIVFLLNLLPYLPIDNLHQPIINFSKQIFPSQIADIFFRFIKNSSIQQDAGLLSVSILLSIWTASAGMYATIKQMNKIYKAQTERPFWKKRAVAILITFVFTLLALSSLLLIVLGGFIQNNLLHFLGEQQIIALLYNVLRWIIAGCFLLTGFSIIYYFAPNIKQPYRFLTPGSIAGTALIILSSLAFRYYIDNFGNYTALYGSLGAIIILMLWLYMSGFVLLLGAKINVLLKAR